MKRDDEKIEKTLFRAYRDRQGPVPGEDWEMSVMRSVRNLPDISEKARWSRLVGKLFWELCPAACALIIFLAIAAYNVNVIPDQDFAQIVASDDTIDMVWADPNG